MNDTEQLVRRCIAVWNERDEARRRQELAATFTADVRYTDPLADLKGIAAHDNRQPDPDALGTRIGVRTQIEQPKNVSSLIQITTPPRAADAPGACARRQALSRPALAGRTPSPTPPRAGGAIGRCEPIPSPPTAVSSEPKHAP
jgi:hypothetical protein